MKWVKRGLGIFVLAIIVVAGGGYLWLRTSLPQLSGEVRVNGPTDPIEIIRDRNGVPHIRARTDDDAYYGLGFVHAQDRLFQMDFMRRLGAGRLSEVMGAATVRIDRMMRILGLYRLAEANLATLSADVRSGLEAYAAGVNAYLRTHPGALPPEFQALRYRPQPWRPADSLVWGRLMAMRLTGNWRTEALRARLARRLSPDQIAQLWPPSEAISPPTLATRAGPAPDRLFAGLMAAWPAALAPRQASNSWAVAGAHTATGKPLLANDPHLGFRAPGIWYLVRIETPGLALTGATAPGMPFTILGHNGRIAWSLTTTESDTQDLFVERLDPDDPGRYLAPGGSLRFSERRETIAVRDGEDVAIVVRETRHGPVISDADPSLARTAGAGHVVALAATALRPDDMTAEAVFRLNRAGDWPGFRRALRNFHSPQQNITYADTSGNIGFIAPARVPLRPVGKAGAGRMPAPGWTGEYDWTGFIPFDELPQSFNPPSGRIVNANQRVVADDYPYYLGDGGAPGYRAKRIHQMLDAADRPHTASSMAAMQLDSVSLMARALVPLMTRPLLTKVPPKSARARQAVALLRRWDGAMDRSRPEPLIFVAWLRAFNRGLYADELGPVFRDYWRLRPNFVRRALSDRQSWCDDVGTPQTETCGQLLRATLSRALDGLARSHGAELKAWRWGDAHYAHFRHPVFGRLPVLDRIAEIRIPADGGGYTVNRGLHWIADAERPFASVHGAGYRAVYDLADLDRSLFMQATGQSGNPLSARYRDRTREWRDGRHFRIPSSRAAALDGAVGVLRLVPVR